MSSLSEQDLLALSDQDLFCGGGCHVFADELFQCLASDGFVLRRIAEGRHPRFQAYHVYVAKGDTAIDCEGIKSESGMLSDYVGSRRKHRYPLTEYKAYPCEQKSYSRCAMMLMSESRITAGLIGLGIVSFRSVDAVLER